MKAWVMLGFACGVRLGGDLGFVKGVHVSAELLREAAVTVEERAVLARLQRRMAVHALTKVPFTVLAEHDQHAVRQGGQAR
jgi:hypothetical protein